MTSLERDILTNITSDSETVQQIEFDMLKVVTVSHKTYSRSFEYPY